jgi:hypothetical protein
MKKRIALLLALCLLLAAASALGEDFSGEWHMVIGNVNVGDFILNADGTASGAITGEAFEGTWTSDDTTVTITFDGSAEEFTYDAETGFLNAKTLGMPLSREKAQVSIDVLTAYFNGEEFEMPEGLDEADIIAASGDFLAFYATMMDSSEAQEPEKPEKPAEADAPELTYLAESFKVVESYSGFRGIYIAKVRNDTDQPLFITDGALTLTDASGNVAGEASYFYTVGSRYLEPGEISFFSMQADLAENTEVTWEKNVTVKTEAYYNTDRIMTLTDPTYTADETSIYNHSMSATVVNDTGEPMPGITVVFVLEDEDGNPLDVSTQTLYRHILGADSTITLVTSVDSKLIEYLQANGITPASVEAVAWAENK